MPKEDFGTGLSIKMVFLCTPVVVTDFSWGSAANAVMTLVRVRANKKLFIVWSELRRENWI